MRKTFAEVEKWFPTLQASLDAMWNLIEDKFEEDWRLDANGDLIFEMDEDKLIEVLSKNPTVALSEFGAYEDHNPEAEKWEWYNLPEALIGTYTIKSVYDESLKLTKGERFYFFTQEGY